ncbi:phage tail assembly protein [Pelosinus sp. IPA-1]|uniref:phage tail assembly protein n=1 Tax=Pelosinus sp. IPA-1 TaxID=3029569 RepID=UPI00243626F3|nr:phage tail assembly protein [Pelosinus sp. IPA-1]GMB00438.1 hypothetical protein PIPA1_32370 [Pelosinus sp. IPA-1]
MPSFKLTKPVEYEGKTFDTINYDLDALTGDDLLTAEMEMTTNGTIAPIIDISKAYHAGVFARAAKVDFGFMRKMPAKDFARATMLVMSFFGGSDL